MVHCIITGIIGETQFKIRQLEMVMVLSKKQYNKKGNIENEVFLFFLNNKKKTEGKKQPQVKYG